jgi:uncharacterized protein YndB with AHSA1/START domain
MKQTGKLNVTASGDREIVISRVFDAPRELVFEAYTRPELLRRWLGVRAGWSWAVCEMDLRAGGAYRWLWRNQDGQEMGVSGEIREIVPGERLVTTERFDPAWYPGEGLHTVTFTEDGGKTTLMMVLRYESRAARDAVLASPASEGLAEGYDKLAEVLASLQRGG